MVEDFVMQGHNSLKGLGYGVRESMGISPSTTIYQ